MEMGSGCVFVEVWVCLGLSLCLYLLKWGGCVYVFIDGCILVNMNIFRGKGVAVFIMVVSIFVYLYLYLWRYGSECVCLCMLFIGMLEFLYFL